MREFKNQKGQAMLEFAIVLPLLMVLLMAAFEFGVAAERYLALSRVAYETSRYSVGLPGLESGTYSDSGSTAIANNHWKLYLRKNILSEKHSFEDSVAMTTNLIRPAAAIGEVTVSLTYRHTPVFPLTAFLGANYSTIPMSLSVKAPYLFRG